MPNDTALLRPRFLRKYLYTMSIAYIHAWLKINKKKNKNLQQTTDTTSSDFDVGKDFRKANICASQQSNIQYCNRLTWIAFEWKGIQILSKSIEYNTESLIVNKHRYSYSRNLCFLEQESHHHQQGQCL